MNTLFTGRGSGGSWAIRGMQLGQAVGAKVDVNCNSLVGIDLVVTVKRPRISVIESVHARGIPLVWDVVDAWPQPVGNEWGHQQCVDWLAQEVATLKPSAIVAATEVMAKDCARFGVPVLTLPHHARPGLRKNPIKERVHIVAYEGGENYLGPWEPFLHKECARRGWQFVVNPPELACADIVVAVRNAKGYAPRNWKSGVKLANAQGSGTPCVLNREQGCLEISSGGEHWADTEKEVIEAFEDLVEQDTRLASRTKLLRNVQELPVLAKRYKEWLCTLKC